MSIRSVHHHRSVSWATPKMTGVRTPASWTQQTSTRSWGVHHGKSLGNGDDNGPLGMMYYCITLY